MTPSEHLWALATERANAPEHMRELFALTIDRVTWETADKINYEIGSTASYNYGLHPRWCGSDYAQALYRYIQLKLRLHRVEKKIAMYGDYENMLWPGHLHLHPNDGLLEEKSWSRGAVQIARAAKNDAIWNIEN